MKMFKKRLALAFAAAIVLTFAGCSNSSDSGAAIFAGGTGTGNGGSGTNNGTGSGTGGGTDTGTENGGGNNGRVLDRTGLPANVGSNDFAGKTFSYTADGATAKYAFGSDTVTFTSTLPSMDTATVETVTVSSYSFNATTKQLFLKKVSSNSYLINDGTRTAMPEPDSITSDAEFIAAYKKSMKQLYPSYTDEQLTNSAKGVRFTTFAPYGYTDSTNATEVSNEIIAKYNAAQAESKTRNTLVDIYAYDLSGSTLKRLSDSRIPAGKGLNEIYGVYSTQYMITSPSIQLANILAIKDGSDNIVYNLNYSSTPSITPDITNAASNVGYRVSSISESAINTSATATGTGLVWTFTSATGSFSYTTNKTATSGVFDITDLGKITVTYATAGNIPADWTAAATYIEDKTQSGGTDLQAESAYFKAEAVSNGVKFTIKKSAASTAYADGNQIIVRTNGGSEIGRIYPDWSDKSQDWTGVYPLVNNGNTYQIQFQSFDNSMSFHGKVKAGGGSGEINYANNPSVSLGLFVTNTVVAAINYPPSLIPASATEKNARIEYYAGTGSWDDATQTWDGDWILNREEASLAEPQDGLCDYLIMSSDADYGKLQTAMKATKNLTKNMFVIFTYKFKLASITGTCFTRHLQSESMDASVLRLTQNDAQSAGDENASIAETSVFKAEAVEGGIKITIKPFAQAVKSPLIRICGTGADKSENRLDLEWADGSVAWTCLYPYVTAGNSYWIALQADSGLAEQTLTLKASSGIGAIPREGSVSLTVAADKITATINDYAVNEKIPGGTSGLTNMWTVLEFFAGDGWVEETSTWDGAYINAFWHDNFTTTLEIPNSDQVYKTLKSKMTGEYNGKKLYFQPYYCIKKPGIPAKIRICNWNTRVAPADMHWN